MRTKGRHVIGVFVTHTLVHYTLDHTICALHRRLKERGNNQLGGCVVGCASNCVRTLQQSFWRVPQALLPWSISTSAQRLVHTHTTRIHTCTYTHPHSLTYTHMHTHIFTHAHTTHTHTLLHYWALLLISTISIPFVRWGCIAMYCVSNPAP